MACKICKHPKHREIVTDYFITESYRKTASNYDVNYNTLHRHITKCVVEVMFYMEERDFQEWLEESVEELTEHYQELKDKEPPKKKKRPKKLVTKPIEWTWSRRSWNKK